MTSNILWPSVAKRPEPFTFDQVKQLCADGTATGETMYCLAGSSDWLLLKNLFPEQATLHFNLGEWRSPYQRRRLIKHPSPYATGTKNLFGLWINRLSKISTSKGNFLVAVALYIFFCIPGIIYTIWALTSYNRAACVACGSTRIVPVESPQGRAILESRTF